MMAINEVKSLIELCKCPILHTLMEDPVIASDGHTYERAAIVAWIESRGARAISPMTGELLVHHELQANYAIKKIIEEYKSKTPQRKQQKLTQKDIELAMKLREEELNDFLKKQQNMLNYLQQQKEEAVSQLGPLARENMRLKEEIVVLRKSVTNSSVDASAQPVLYSSALKPPAQPPKLPMPSSPSQRNHLRKYLGITHKLEKQQEILVQNYSANVIKRAIGCYISYKQMKKSNFIKSIENLTIDMDLILREFNKKESAQKKYTIET